MFRICSFVLLILAIFGFISCEKKSSVGPIDYSKITDINYQEHIQPIFISSCIGCHSGNQAAVGLKLDSWQNLIKGSRHGEAIIPFDAENSILIEMLTKLVGGPHPAEQLTDTLETGVVDFLSRWIEEGAKNSNGEVPYENSENRLYVCNQNSAMISIIDTEAQLVIRNIKLAELGFSPNSKPHHIAVEPDGSFWYVTLIDENKVLKFNDLNEKVGEATIDIPALLAVHPPDDFLYVSRFMLGGNIPNSIGVIKRSTMEVLDEINVQFDIPHALAAGISGNFVFTASLSQNQAIAINSNTGEVDQFIALGQSQGPLQVAVSPDENELYISAQLAHQMLVVDLVNGVVASQIPVGNNPWHPVFLPSGEKLYVGNFGSNSVSVINTISRIVEHTITGNGLAQPHGIAVSNDGLYVFVSNRNTSKAYTPRYDFGDNSDVGTVTVINTSTNIIEKIIEVERFASGMGIWEKP